MAGFYYFFEGQEPRQLNSERDGKLNIEALRKYGLEHVFGDRQVTPDETVVARVETEMGIGVLLYPKPSGSELPRGFYDPERQEWCKFANFWIGWDKESPPTPDELLKTDAIFGPGITDGKGKPWTIPTILSNDINRVTMPQVYGYDDQGNFRLMQRESDKTLWELAGKVATYLLGDEGGDMTDEEIAQAALAFLSVNYRVGKPEVFALFKAGHTLLETKFVAGIFSAVTDFGRVQDFKKKDSITE